MKKIFALMGILAALIVPANIVHADPGPYDAYLTTDPCDTNGSDGVVTPCTSASPEINVADAINYLLSNAGVVSPFTDNTSLDPIQLNFPHAYWTNSGGVAVLAAIAVSAGGTNIPGIYEQGNPGSTAFMTTGVTGSMFLGDGSLSDPFPGLFNPFGGNFGVLVDHQGENPDTLYSDPVLNSDALDHMMAFDLRSFLDGKTIYMDFGNGNIQAVVLTDTYYLAFEDKPLGLSDHDYNDLGFLFAHVTPVPEPMTMALFGTGLLGMAVRRNKKA